MADKKTPKIELQNGGWERKGSLSTDMGTADFGFQKVPEQEKRRQVQQQFDSIAGTYDLMNTLLSLGVHYRWKHLALRFLGLRSGESVIDVCGGTGDLSVMATRRVGPGGKVVLYDMNRAMIEVGRRKSTHAKERKKVLYVQGDAEHSALRSESVDAAMVGFGVRNLTHMEAGLQEMYRLLKPGGRFVCLEFSKPTSRVFRRLYDFYSFRVMPLVGFLVAGSRRPFTYLPESIRLFPSPDELSRILEGIGFQRVTYRPLTNGIAVIHVAIKAPASNC